jgi:cyclic beta-1,2-glucan synthetase
MRFSFLKYITLLIETVRAKRVITPAGEWLLDNFYLIEEQIRTGKKHLPKGYSRELPRLMNGLPRVYDIAQEIISHGDGRVDPENLGSRFVPLISLYPIKDRRTLGNTYNAAAGFD